MTSRMPRCRQAFERDRGRVAARSRSPARHRSPSRHWALAAVWAGAFCLPAADVGTGRCRAAEVGTPLVELSAGDLAAPANGQIIYAIDERQRTIVAIEPLATAKQRVAVAAAPEAGPRPVAVACIDTTTLVAVCLTDESWSLRSWRLKPDTPADPAQPLQTLSLGDGAGSAASVRLAVNASRDWLAVSGLPAPLPPVLRAAIAGNRIGKCSDRGCPRLEEKERPVALAISPADELVLVCRPAPTAADQLSFHDLGGRRLLHLDLDLPAVHDIAFARGDGTLWAVGGIGESTTHPEGLWRLDAGLRDGRQVVAAVRIAGCPSPRAVLCPAEKTILVATGEAGGRILRFQSSPADRTQVQP